MKLPRRRFLYLAAGAAALAAVSRMARAQTYPTRPIRLVIPFPRVVHSTPSGARWRTRSSPCSVRWWLKTSVAAALR